MIRSFYNHYGVLSISLITMTIFGQFGLRPSQTKHKCLAYVLDIWFLCSYTAICVPILLQIEVLFSVFQSGLNHIFNLYSAVYAVIIVITFTFWLILTFKKYNICCLLEDVVSIRRATLGKRDIVCITAISSIIGAVFISNGVLTILATNWNISPLYIFFIVLYANITWMLMWNITFIMCVMALIISREFEECITDLNITSEERSLCADKFFKIAERFTELSLVVNKLDFMFSFAVGIILTMALSTLCCAIYAVVSGEDPTIWYIATAYSALSLGFLLFSLSSLNYRVRNYAHLTLEINYTCVMLVFYQNKFFHRTLWSRLPKSISLIIQRR